MVLESRWADAPEKPPVAAKADKTNQRRAKRSPRKKTPRDKNPQDKEHSKPAPRLTFSVRDVPANPPPKGDKKDLLRKRIEEQRKIYERTQHQNQQKQLLEDFLNGDTKLQWSDEDEEDEILAKLNRSLKI